MFIIFFICCFFRRSRTRRGLASGSIRDEECYQGKAGPGYSDHQRNKADPTYTQSENDYYKTWQMQVTHFLSHTEMYNTRASAKTNITTTSTFVIASILADLM